MVLPEVRKVGIRETWWRGETILGEVAMAVLVGFFIPHSLAGLFVPFIMTALILTLTMVILRDVWSKAHTRLVRKTYLAGRNGSNVAQQLETLFPGVLGLRRGVVNVQKGDDPNRLNR